MKTMEVYTQAVPDDAIDPYLPITKIASNITEQRVNGKERKPGVFFMD
jgi:hypothetical protein